MNDTNKARELVTKLRGICVSAIRANYAVLGAAPLITANETIQEAADLITELDQALEYAEAKDTPDALTPQIKEATQAPGYWSIYAQALELVSNRYSKSGLVHLTAFLMMREQAQVEENRRLREALRPFASAWGIAQASGLTDMSRLGALARNETASVYFMRARAALSSTGEKG